VKDYARKIGLSITRKLCKSNSSKRNKKNFEPIDDDEVQVHNDFRETFGRKSKISNFSFKPSDRNTPPGN